MAKKPEPKPAPKVAAVKPAPDPRVVTAKRVETFNNGRQDRVVYTHQRAKSQ